MGTQFWSNDLSTSYSFRHLPNAVLFPPERSTTPPFSDRFGCTLSLVCVSVSKTFRLALHLVARHHFDLDVARVPLVQLELCAEWSRCKDEAHDWAVSHGWQRSMIPEHHPHFLRHQLCRCSASPIWNMLVLVWLRVSSVPTSSVELQPGHNLSESMNWKKKSVKIGSLEWNYGANRMVKST